MWFGALAFPFALVFVNYTAFSSGYIYIYIFATAIDFGAQFIQAIQIQKYCLPIHIPTVLDIHNDLRC